MYIQAQSNKPISLGPLVQPGGSEAATYINDSTFYSAYVRTGQSFFGAMDWSRSQLPAHHSPLKKNGAEAASQPYRVSLEWLRADGTHQKQAQLQAHVTI